MKFESHSLKETENIATSIANSLSFPSCVYLQGELGAGKTTLCQFIIKVLGYQGAVTSPTYNLIQEYQVDSGMVYHMDLYRLQDPGELEFLGINELWSERSVFLIEWPNRGGSTLLQATHRVNINNKNLERKTYKQFEFTKLDN